jgi:general L-amino acid transport system substrate-binding protein
MKTPLLSAALLALCCTTAHASTDTILAKGRLRCGTVAELLDWNKDDLHGRLVPIEVEVCHAISAALFGRADRADMKALATEADALAAVKKGEIDMVAGVTPGAANEKTYGVAYSVPFFIDGQALMVHRASGIHGLNDLGGRKVCFIDNTETGGIILHELGQRRIKPIPFAFQEEGEMDAAIMDRHCEATTAYVSKLAEARMSFNNAKDFQILPQLLTVVPVTVAVPASDPRLRAIADYTISAVLQAEAAGVTRENVAVINPADDERLRRITGLNFATAYGLGLPHDWARGVIAAVGNYAELYDRSIGPGTRMDLPRGANALWSNGGLMAPLPLQ